MAGYIISYYICMQENTHIRPHFGPTNTQLKAHLGLVVPRSVDGTVPCTTMRVGQEERAWEEGKAWLFDDSFLVSERV